MGTDDGAGAIASAPSLIVAEVAEARERGLDAHGWLAGGRGIGSIVEYAEYAERIAADLVPVPEGALDRGPLALDEGGILEVARDLPHRVRVATVHPDGSLEERP